MKRFIPTACLAAAFAVGLSAQTPSPAQEPQAAAAGGSKNVTVTGCLKAGDEPGSYALSNIKPAAKDSPSATSPSPAGTTGTTGAASASKDLEGISSLKLTGSPAGANLSEHVGHTVRISGALNAASSSAGAAAGANPSPAGAAGGAAKASPSLEVSSISMVSGSCSQ
jgi:hypothetical protein